jgi:ribosomal protein S18 acetylase RimI-like enzyme
MSGLKGRGMGTGYNAGMASITMPVQAESHVPLRPLNILHDLPQVADLIELCFESTMDDDGQSYVQQMRKASKDQDFLRWAGRVMESTSMPLAGYVWEEGGKIIGNVSLVFQVHQGRKLALIANVATHPNYRRHGIGRTLTERGMLGARQKGAREIWLQVRDDNPTAIRIYADLGFVERARRTTYHSRSALTNEAPTRGESPASPRAVTPQISISRPAARHWPRQLTWLQRAHPDEISWYSHWDWMKLGPGLPNAVYRFVVQYDMRQWAAAAGHELLASATWVPSYRQPNTLWLAAAPDGGPGVTRVLEAARNELARYRRLTVEYPAGELCQEIEAAGFAVFRTLLWMRATGVEHPRIDQ